KLPGHIFEREPCRDQSVTNLRKISICCLIFEHPAVALEPSIKQIHLLEHFQIDFAKLEFLADRRRCSFNRRCLFLRSRNRRQRNKTGAQTKRKRNQGSIFASEHNRRNCRSSSHAGELDETFFESV